MVGPDVLGVVELVRLRLPLVEPWVTALGTIAERDVLLVRVELGGAVGWGECVAQPEPTYSAEYTAGAQAVLAAHLVPRLLAARPSSASEVAPALAGVKGHPMAKAALELAVLDAELRRAGRNLAADLWARSDVDGQPPASVAAGVAVGVAGDIGALVDEVDRRVEEGYRRVKLKIHPGWDIEPVTAVRDGHPHLLLQVDANGSYAPLGAEDAARALVPLDACNLLMIEQPLAADDLLGHAELAWRLSTPLCLDESIDSIGAAEAALALGACAVINVKAGRIGGYLAAVRLHDICLARHVSLWCGGMLETGVGRAANLALATLPAFCLPGDLSAADRFWVDDIVTHPARLDTDGTIAVPVGPGLGVEVVSDLGARTIDRARWVAPPR